jgi:hypothetical protein
MAPQEDLVPRNVALGHRPVAVRPNSGEPAAGSGRARAEGDLRGPWARFRQEFGAVVLPARGLGGAGRRLPLDYSLRRALGRGKEGSGTPSSSRD